MGGSFTRRILAIIVVLLTVAPAAFGQFGQFGMRQWLDPDIGKSKPKPKATWAGNRDFPVDVVGQGARFSGYRQQLAFSVPAYRGETDELAVHGRVGAWDLTTTARLPATGRRLPDRLWRIGMGAAYRRKLDTGAIWGVDVSIGSASDRPFDTGEEFRFSATGMLRLPETDNEGWLLLLTFVNAREWLPYIPLPGAGYIVNRQGNFRGLLGVPYTFIQYSPIDRLRLDLRYLMLRNVYAQATYNVLPKVGLYTRFTWNTDAYMLSRRRDKDDRLFYDDKRIAAGVRWQATETIVLDLSSGYAFDRFFFLGRTYDDRDNNRIDLEDGPFLSAIVRMRF